MTSSKSQTISLANIGVDALSGVGKRMAETLAKLGIESVQDLLFHLPMRYVDRTKITPIGSLRTNTTVVIQGRVLKADIAFGKRRSLAVSIEDMSGSCTLRFYHFSAAQKNNFEKGKLVRCFGDPRLGASGLEFYHPEYDFISENKATETEETLTPIYPLTEGLGQTKLKKLVEQAVKMLQDSPPTDLLPDRVNTHFGVSSLAEALRFLHFPPPDTNVDQIINQQHPAQLRLAFEELLAHFLVRQEMRAHVHQKRGPIIKKIPDSVNELIHNLPFSLTSAQTRVIKEIREDFTLGVPMLRMVQGDVGSGKTLVAALVALQVAAAGYQVAVVAPTEILAEQHLHNFTHWLEPLGIRVEWLVGKLTAAKRRQALANIASGDAQVIVGTHALFQEDVEFECLGLSIIDEQHRFGVDQRLSLRKTQKTGESPHQLVMTATPIPRTLAMAAYSELDYSVIDELPPGRQPIQTALISQGRRDDVIARIQHACDSGTQAYWVCPLVEDSETLSAANAEQTVEDLRSALPNLSVALVHGRLKPTEKETVMAEFKAAKHNVLVATTVIEVGVDVPNANLMIIENPERLGLAQLHQLRGRVGRGSQASHCVLLYGDKLSQHAKERLKVLRESTDGFVIAQRDLEIRGPGELLGTRQAGDMSYRLADLQHHAHLVPNVHEIGKQIFETEPERCKLLVKRWIGHRVNYADA